MYFTTPQHAILHAGGLSANNRILELGAIGDHTNREFTSLVNTQGVPVSSLCIANLLQAYDTSLAAYSYIDPWCVA